MINQTNYKIAKTYHKKIKEIQEDEYGIWVILNKGYKNSHFESHVIYDDTISSIKEELQNITVCECNECIPIFRKEYVCGI